MKAKHVKFANCHSDCRCSDDKREEFPPLPSPGDNPPVSGGQATGKLHTFVKPQPGKANALGKTSPGKDQATGSSNAFVNLSHGRWRGHHEQGGEKTVRIL